MQLQDTVDINSQIFGSKAPTGFEEDQDDSQHNQMLFEYLMEVLLWKRIFTLWKTNASVALLVRFLPSSIINGFQQYLKFQCRANRNPPLRRTCR